MKILFLTNNLQGNDGRSRVSLDFAEQLQSLKHEVLCLTSKRSSQNRIKEYVVLKDSLKYLVNPLTSFYTALKVNKIIREFSPEIIHFVVEPYAALLPFLKLGKTKAFLTVHGTYSVIPILFDDFLKKIISNYLSKNYYKTLHRVIAVSNYTKSHLLKYFPELRTKIKVITNGINLREHKIINLSQRPKNKIKKILFVGAIKHRKGVLEAIESLKYYQDNFSDNFVYEIVGEYNKNDNYYCEIIKKIKEYGFEDKVIFQGKAIGEKLQEYYCNADLFLMLPLNIKNEFEGFGLVYLEANSKGVPCIGSTNCGAQEAVFNNRTGYVVDPYKAKQVAEKIDLVLNQNKISSQECIDWAKTNDIKIKVKELINLYEEVR